MPLNIVKLLNLTADEAQIQITLEFTALRELHSFSFTGDILYDLPIVPNSYPEYFDVRMGNSINQEAVKSKNISVGKHIANTVISLNFYEIKDLLDITGFEYQAYVYKEEQ